MNESPTDKTPPRVAVFSMFCLADQYDLAAEFEQMLKVVAEDCEVLHLSMRGPRPPPPTTPRIRVEELPIGVNRASRKDILRKSILFYFTMPLAAIRLRRFKPDVIYLPDIIPMAGFLTRLLTWRRVAVSYGDWHLHNKFGRKAWAAPLLAFVRFLEFLEVKTVNAFTCRATAAAERLKAWGVKPEGIRVFHDAPDMSAFNPHDESALRKQCGFAKDDVVILYHGVMHAGKGLDRLVSWSADLYRENPRIGLILVGDGPALPELKALVKELGIEHRDFFTGWLKTTREVGNFCNAADICVAMRTGDEGNVHIIPGALLHCMACRKVVIAPRLPGISEILRHGDNGFMFKADDGEDFKKLLRELVDRRGDWDRVAEAAYQDILRNFSVEATARAYGGALSHFAQLGR